MKLLVSILGAQAATIAEVAAQQLKSKESKVPNQFFHFSLWRKRIVKAGNVSGYESWIVGAALIWKRSLKRFRMIQTDSGEMMKMMESKGIDKYSLAML